MLTVHHLNNSRSQRVLWLLEELGVPYDIVRYQRQSNMQAPRELAVIHPLGKSPVVTDDGDTIAESGAIIEYIVGKHGDGRLIPPPDTPERLRYTYWLHYAEGSAMPPLLMKLLFSLMPRRAPALLRPLVGQIARQALTTLVDPQLKQHMAFWETELNRSEWFAGDVFTAARVLALATWLVAASVPPSSAASSAHCCCSPPSTPPNTPAASAAPAGTRMTVCSASQAESTSGTLSATNSTSRSAPLPQSTTGCCSSSRMWLSVCGSRLMPSAHLFAGSWPC